MHAKLYESVEALQADLDAWLHHYNHERPHLGYRNQGRRPWETVERFVSSEARGIERLAQMNVGANTVVVALIVLMLSDISGHQPVSVSGALWRQLGLSRDARKRALDALERAALIRTERSPGRATRIWLLVKP